MNKERLVNTFIDLVQIYSPTGGEEKMALETARRLKTLGLEPHVDQHFNVIASKPGNSQKEPIILNAHLDTVEPGKGIKPQIVDGVIRSDGTTILGVDNKAPIAAYLEVLETLKEEKDNDHRPLDIIFTVHEEADTDGPRLLDYNRFKARKGYAFDSTTTLGTIVMASPFYNRFDLEIQGRSSHASRPHLGDNSVIIAVNALHGLKLGQVDDDSVRNIRLIDGEARVSEDGKLLLMRNAAPGIMIGKGEVRSYLEEKVEKYTTEVKERFDKAIKEYGSEFVNLKFEAVRENGGFKFADDEPFVIDAEKRLRKLGITPNRVTTFGCMDANVFAEKGVMIMNMGDGGTDAHAVTESISVENLHGLAKVVYGLIKE